MTTLYPLLVQEEDLLVQEGLSLAHGKNRLLARGEDVLFVQEKDLRLLHEDNVLLVQRINTHPSTRNVCASSVM